MAKAETKTEAPKSETKKASAPAGYNNKSEDVVGFCDIESQGPIHGIPRAAKLSDSKIEKNKSSMFVIFELIDSVSVTVNEGKDNAQTLVAKPGEMVGVWTKPGMKGIRSLCGCKVWMNYAGQKDIGKPSPMKVYDIMSPDKGGSLIPIIEDNRETSREAKTFLDAKMTAEELKNLPF